MYQHPRNYVFCCKLWYLVAWVDRLLLWWFQMLSVWDQRHSHWTYCSAASMLICISIDYLRLWCFLQTCVDSCFFHPSESASRLILPPAPQVAEALVAKSPRFRVGNSPRRYRGVDDDNDHKKRSTVVEPLISARYIQYSCSCIPKT